RQQAAPVGVAHHGEHHVLQGYGAVAALGGVVGGRQQDLVESRREGECHHDIVASSRGAQCYPADFANAARAAYTAKRPPVAARRTPFQAMNHGSARPASPATLPNRNAMPAATATAPTRSWMRRRQLGGGPGMAAFRP